MTDWQLKTPVALLIFNRPDTTEKVFERIRQAKPPKLLVVADGPRTNRSGEADKCDAARAIVDGVDWQCEVLKNYSETNLGCRHRVSSGLNWVFDRVEEAIILEDDCLPHPTFFRFCEELLERYRYDDRIMAISGDNFQFGRHQTQDSYYFSRYMHIWGWATWRRAWMFYDLDMKKWPDLREINWLKNTLQSEGIARFWSSIFQNAYNGFNTWDYAWVFACWLREGLIILPNANLVSNIGFNSEATHTKVVTQFTNMPTQEITFPLLHPLVVSRNVEADNFTEKMKYSGDEGDLALTSTEVEEKNRVQKAVRQTCKICGSLSPHFSHAKILERYDVEYFQCSNCGFVQTEEPYWLDEAYSSAIASSDVGLVSRNLMFSKITSNLILTLFDSEGKFLDYGGGYGLFVRLMRDLGLDFYWHDRYASNFLAQGFEIDEWGNIKLELVTAFELFEHFVHPLNEIEQLLKFSKNILFSTELLPGNNPKPNEWWYYATHEGQHIALYTQKALAIVAKRFKLNLYSNGVNLHLLTEKQLSPQAFHNSIRYEPPQLSKPSLISQDYQSAIAKRQNRIQKTVTESERKKMQKQEKVIIDAVFFQLYQTGIARLWRSLLEEWAKQNFSKQILVLDRDGTAPKIPGIKYLCVRRYDYNNTEADRQLLQQICDEEGADLFVSSYYTTPVTTPSVFMAYDMIPEISGYDANNPMWREKTYGLQHASAYIAISENTAQDLVKFLPKITKDSITVAPCGVSGLFSLANPDRLQSFKTKYGISKPYFMLVGMRVGYKNAILFFKAFSKLENKEEFEVVCTGGGNLLEPEFQPYVSGIRTHMLQLSDEELSSAYSGAMALAFPSQYEGFGLPVLEAMACGCPVITCPRASIPEVGGNAVIYVNDPDVDGMLKALQEVQKHEVRNRLIAAGLERAKQFSWSAMADKVRGALLEAANPLTPKTSNLAQLGDRLLTQVKHYQNNPLDRRTVNRLFQLRQQLSQTWLTMPFDGLESEYNGQLGQAHIALWNSGLKNELPRDEDQPFLQRLAAKVTQGFEKSDAIQALIAATLYFYPHQLSIQYQRAPIPNWFANSYLQFMFDSPRLFKDVGEVDRYAEYLSGWIGYLHGNITRNTDSSVWDYVAGLFGNNANLTPLYFSNKNLKDAQIQRAEILERYLTQKGCNLDYQFPERSDRRPKIRLGILCQNFYPSAETFTVLPVFELLDRERFDIHLYALEIGKTESEQLVRDRANKFVSIGGNSLNSMVQTLRNDDLDILLIGSNITARSYPITLLSLHRLARIQTVSLADPVTTGMRNVDCYIAGRLTIPQNAQEYYHEKLVTVEGSGLCFRFPQDPNPTLNPTRQSWGATAETTIFISGSNFRKINPELRQTWAKILAAVPNSILVLYPFGPNWGRHPYLEMPFYQQMQAVFSKNGVDPKRLVLVKTLPTTADIRKCLELADIYLDSYPYSGAASALDPLRVNLPLVVMEGEELRHRQSAALLRELQIPDLIVHSETEYIQLAVSLGTNPQLRQQKRQQINTQMQQQPHFLDRRVYSEKMGVLFQKLFQEWQNGVNLKEVDRGEIPPQESTTIATQTVDSYQSIKAAVEAIEGYLIPGQEEYLFNKVKSLPEDAVIVEIGSFRGRSTVAMAYACVGTRRKIYCIDPWDFRKSKTNPNNIFEFWTQNIKQNGLIQYVVPLRGYSEDIFSRWNEMTGGEEIDFIFIDGDHNYSGVLKDFKLSFPLVKPDGWIAFHDFNAGFDGVDRVWNETAKFLLRSYESCSTIACGQKIASSQCQVEASLITPQFLNRLMGCVNLYQIDPSDEAMISDLTQIRRQLSEYFLNLPTEQLEATYQGEVGKAYKVLLKSGFQKEPIEDTEQTFLQQLTQQGAGLVHPKALNALLGVLLYYPPGKMKVQDARTRLPGWLIENYEQVFEQEGRPIVSTPSQPSVTGETVPSPSAEFLNRLLGCINLYEIDPSESSIVQELRQLRREFSQYWLNLPLEELEATDNQEVVQRYKALLKSGFQNEPLNETEQKFLQDITQMGTQEGHPKSRHAMLIAMLYCAPGKLKIQNARNRLPNWSIEDYEQLFETS